MSRSINTRGEAVADAIAAIDSLPEDHCPRVVMVGKYADHVKPGGWWWVVTAVYSLESNHKMSSSYDEDKRSAKAAIIDGSDTWERG